MNLTDEERSIVDKQCSRCKLWDSDDGCLYDDNSCPEPQDECDVREPK